MSDEKELISNEVPLLVDNKNQGSEKDLDFFMVHITMSEAINQILEKSDYSLFLCATGYFHPLGWDLIKKELEKCQKVYLLIGRPYLIPKDSESILKKTYQELLEDIPIQDLHLWTFIPDLIKWLKEEYVLVRLHESPFLHGKMYWTPSNAYVGSSNLTKDGLAINTELNVLLNNPNQIELLKKWFFNRWNEHGSIPHKDELIETLDKSRFGAYPYHPFIVYMKAVYEYYKDLLDIQDMTKKSVVDLAKFQKQGVNKALQILATHNGVMISDSVGLGKSFILMSLLDQCHPRRVLLLAPAQLRESWRMNLETYNLDRVVEFYSIEKLATQIPQKVTGEAFDYDYIAIDESHAFRNPETKRYRNLMKLLPRGKFQSKIILLTATPINTSIMDLYYQMKIITKGTDRYPSIQDVGIPSLLDYFKDVMKPADSPEHKDIDVLKQNLMIARSRSEIRFRQDVLNEDIYIPTKNNGRKLIKFPKRSLPPVEYSLFPKLEQDIEKTSKNDAKLFYKEIGDILYELKLPAITIELYKKAEFQDNKILLRTNAIINMLRTMFLKRLESSIESFKDSIRIQRILAMNLKSSFKKDLVLKSCFIRFCLEEEKNEIGEDVDITDYLDEIDTEDLQKYQNKNYLEKLERDKFEDFSKILKDIEEDVVRFDRILSLVQAIKKDLKLEKLKELLIKYQIKNNQNPEKMIIFSYFKTTATYLFNSLTKDNTFLQNIGNPIIELICGDVDNDQRSEKVKRFAPYSNTPEGVIIDEKYLKNPIHILIATDVLSEGQNLQDAKYLINFDLHWNPVRLIQRSGRIDRIGARHEEIFIFNFLPEKGLDELLKLEERIEKRLADIDNTMELDADTLKTDDAKAKRRRDYTKMYNGDTSLLDEQEEFVDIGNFDFAKRLLLEQMKNRAEDYYKNIPCGIHSWKIHPNLSGLAIVFEYRRADSKTVQWIFHPDKEHESNFVLKNGLSFGKEIVEPIMRCTNDTEGRSSDREDPEPLKVVFERIKDVLQKAESTILEDFALRDTTSKKDLEIGNKKYYELINDAVEDGLIKRKKAKKFIIYLENFKFQQIRSEAEVKEIVKNLDEIIESEDTVQNKKKNNSNQKKELNEQKKIIIDNFLDKIYEYFDQKHINIEESTKKSQTIQIKVISVMRLYTPEILANINVK